MRATLNNWRGSPRKFVKYLRAVQKKNAIEVTRKLEFVCSPYAIALRKLILCAISNASNDASIDVNKLIVKEASVGRGAFLNRGRQSKCFRGRGRIGRVTTPQSNVCILLSDSNKTEQKTEQREQSNG